MLFRPLRSRTVRWRPEAEVGLEHLTLEARPDGTLEARSVVIGERGGVSYGIRYGILCDADWRVREFALEDTAGRRLAMASPEPGRWFHADGMPARAFDGCTDIDLAATPFTNTLPIRRLGLTRAHGPREFAMLYVPFDTLEPVRDDQRYTALADGTLYRYEAVDGTFEADLPVDEDGLVVDYPGLFRRI